jgi:putative PEP-CTERM system TPR-repeat lipoprotein
MSDKSMSDKKTRQIYYCHSSPDPSLTRLIPALLLAGIIALLPIQGMALMDEDYAKAREYKAEGETNSAIITLKNLLQKQPDHAEGRYLLGKLLFEKGQFEQAAKELKRALDLGVDPARIIPTLGRSYLKTGSNDTVLNLVQPDEFESPVLKSDALALVGHAHLGLGNKQEARDSFTRALEYAENSFANVGMAKLAILDQQLDLSLDYSDKALASIPEDEEAKLTRAQALSIKGNLQEAISVLDELLDQSPENLRARLARAEFHFRLGNYGQAMTDVNKILDKHEFQPNANFLLSRLYMEQNNYQDALDAAEKVLKVLPDQDLGHLAAGTANFALQQYEAAHHYLNRYLAANGNNQTITLMLTATYFHLNDFRSAIDLLGSYTENSGTVSATILDLLGQAYLKNGDYDQALPYFRRALELDPDNLGMKERNATVALVNDDIETAVQYYNAIENEKRALSKTNIQLMALTYIKASDFERAFNAIERGLAQFPDSAELHFIKAVAFNSLGNFQAATKSLEETLAMDGDFIPALMARAKFHRNAQQDDQAEALYRKVLSRDPGHMRALIELAELNLARGDAGEFLTLLEKARSVNPAAFEPVQRLGEYYLDNKNYDKASYLLLRFHQAHPDNPGPLDLLIRLHQAQGNTAKAESFMNQLLVLRPERIDIRLQLIHKEIPENPQVALKMTNEALVYAPDYIPLLITKFNLLLQTGRQQEAEDFIDYTEKALPGQYIAPQLKGEFYLSRGMPEKALAFFETAYGKEKTRFLTERLAMLYQKTGHAEKSVAVLSDYLASFPGDSRFKLHLATAHQALGHTDKAIQLYEESATDFPDNPLIANNLALLYLETDIDTAKKYARKAYLNNRDRPEIMDTYGWVLLQAGETESALNILELAVHQAPNNPEIRYHLAYAYFEKNQLAKARTALLSILNDGKGSDHHDKAKRLLSTVEGKMSGQL